MPTPNRFARRIAELQAIQQFLEEVGRRAAAHPHAYKDDIAAELRAIADDLSPPADDDGEDPPDGGPSNYQKMQSYFLARGNAPAAAQDISDGAGVSYESVRSLLYKRNRGRFTRTGSQPGLWRLADPNVGGEKPSDDPERENDAGGS